TVNREQRKVLTTKNIIPIETAIDFKRVSKDWNIYTNRWLKESVFEKTVAYFNYHNYLNVDQQTTTKLIKPWHYLLASLFTFLVSAIWHGLKLGYLYIFIGFFFGIMTVKESVKTIREIFCSQDSNVQSEDEKSKDVKDFKEVDKTHGQSEKKQDNQPVKKDPRWLIIFSTIQTNMIVNYLTIPFSCASGDLKLKIYNFNPKDNMSAVMAKSTDNMIILENDLDIIHLIWSHLGNSLQIWFIFWITVIIIKKIRKL
ncbi:hypothetical protein M153_11404000887, partial [Pseudoloma neurophilia]